MMRAVLHLGIITNLVILGGVALSQPTPPKPLCVVDYTPGENAYCAPNDPCGAYLETGTSATRGNIHWCNPADNLFDLVQQFSRTGKAGEVAFTEDPAFTDKLELCDAASNTCIYLDCSSGTWCEVAMEGLSTEVLKITNDMGQIRFEPCDGGGACGGTTTQVVAETEKFVIGRGTAIDVNLTWDLDTDKHLYWDESEDEFNFTDDLEVTGNLNTTGAVVAATHVGVPNDTTGELLRMDYALTGIRRYDIVTDASTDYPVYHGAEEVEYFRLDTTAGAVRFAKPVTSIAQAIFSNSVSFITSAGLTADATPCVRDDNVIACTMCNFSSVAANGCATMATSTGSTIWSRVTVYNSDGADALTLHSNTVGTTTINGGTSIAIAPGAVADCFDMGAFWTCDTW